MADRFVLHERLGRGAMGEVWRATDTEAGRDVALKLLLGQHADDPGYRRRFEREAELARRIRSPHVVRIHGYGVRGGSPFLALELVEGSTLRDEMNRRGTYTWDEARPVLAQVARGLEATHAAGILHRDVKPSNVLLTRAGLAKLSDFGIATGEDVTPLTASAAMLGTPTYLAPEGPRDPRSDLYGLGVVAYEMLAGYPPFTGPTNQAIVVAHITRPPDLTPIPPEARPLVAALLAKRPEGRPASAAAVATALEGGSAIAGPRTLGATAPVLPADMPALPDLPGVPGSRRSAAPSTLVLAGLVAVAGGAIWALTGGGAPIPAEPTPSASASAPVASATPAPSVAYAPAPSLGTFEVAAGAAGTAEAVVTVTEGAAGRLSEIRLVIDGSQPLAVPVTEARWCLKAGQSVGVDWEGGCATGSDVSARITPRGGTDGPRAVLFTVALVVVPQESGWVWARVTRTEDGSPIEGPPLKLANVEVAP